MATASYALPPPSGVRLFTSMLARPRPLPETTSVDGQTAIITGGYVGIGLKCAEQLLNLGLARLVLGVRTPSKGDAVAADLRKRYPSATIEVWPLDLLSYESVQSFAARCETLDRIDLTILNAAAIADTFVIGPEGHEVAYQTNYLSTVLLAHLLLPILKVKAPQGKPGRLTLVNSASAYMGKPLKADTKPLLAAFDDAKGWINVEAYCEHKALAHAWILKLVEQVKPEDVIVNLVDPGFCSGTGLHRDLTGLTKIAFALMKPIGGRTMEQGATTYIQAAVVMGSESHGSFISDWKISPYVKWLYGLDGAQLAERVWNETLKELAFAKLKERLDEL